MFSRRATHQDSTSSKHRTGKISTSGRAASTTRTAKRSFREHQASVKSRRQDQPEPRSHSTSPIITVCVGPDRRLFAAHEDILSRSPHFFTLCRAQVLEPTAKRINLPDEIPEIFSSVLEYLYKGDYSPRLRYNKRRDTWDLEDTTCVKGNEESAITHPVTGQSLLKDTVLYCAAERYGLDELKRLALRKQGLQSGVQCSTILASARYAYANTPDTDSKLRAHYLALLIRSRSTFKRSGTMQLEMESGGRLFFDLFVAMCNHMDDITNVTKSPR